MDEYLWWWEGCADPDCPRPSLTVEVSDPKRFKAPKKAKKVLMHRFGFQPRPVRVRLRG